MVDTTDLTEDVRPDSELTREEVIARNLSVVEANFHNENPEGVDKAIAFYADDITWEAPFRGQIYTDPMVVREAYMGVFRTVKHNNKTTALRRFATEIFVFDDHGDLHRHRQHTSGGSRGDFRPCQLCHAVRHVR